MRLRLESAQGPHIPLKPRPVVARVLTAAVFALVATSLGACGTDSGLAGKNYLGYFGPAAPPPPRTEAVAVAAADITAQVRSAGGPVSYVEAGYYLVDHSCDMYFDNLILAQNRTHFAGDVVLATGTAASALESVRKKTEVAARQLARIAAGVALATTVFDAFDKRALMTPYPSETKTLIVDALYDYRQHNRPTSATSYGAAVLLVERYAEICTYSGITRYAKQALTRPSQDTAPPPPTTVLDKLQAAAASSIGFVLDQGDQPLNDRQLAILQFYLNENKSAFATAGAAVSLLRELPPGVQTQLVDAKGLPTDPSSDAKAKAVATKAGPILARLKVSNVEFKAIVDQVGADFEAAKKADAAAQSTNETIVETLPPTPAAPVAPVEPRPALLPIQPAVARPVRIY
jgi:hypothetical protein